MPINYAYKIKKSTHTFAGPQARHMLNLNADAVRAEQFHENVLQ